MYRAPRGTFDILPEEQPYWRYVEHKAADVTALYGYQRIDTPVFEDAGLFTRTVGAGTDIVEKEMYTFEDRGGNRLALIPEGTASICRAYIEHGMHSLPQPVKLYYFASVFRYERPQAGRFRQHHQFGCEAIGEDDPALDAEVISMAWQFFKSLPLARLFVSLNSIGCKECRPNYLDALQEYYARHGSHLCADCQVRLERNPLRLLDCKQPACQPVADAAPRSVDYLCPPCREHFDSLQRYLALLDIPYGINHRLVRGLDYYTRTVFEIQPETEGGQSTVGGGGRYDNLIEELGGKPTPAVGFATGFERVILNIKNENVAVPPLPGPQVFIAYLAGEAKEFALKLAADLRAHSDRVLLATGSRSLKAQLRQANGSGVPYTIIIGEDELKSGKLSVRNMSTGEQQVLDFEGLRGLLARLP